MRETFADERRAYSKEASAALAALQTGGTCRECGRRGAVSVVRERRGGARGPLVVTMLCGPCAAAREASRGAAR